jgi:hypothetical protein
VYLLYLPTWLLLSTKHFCGPHCSYHDKPSSQPGSASLWRHSSPPHFSPVVELACHLFHPHIECAGTAMQQTSHSSNSEAACPMYWSENMIVRSVKTDTNNMKSPILLHIKNMLHSYTSVHCITVLLWSFNWLVSPYAYFLFMKLLSLCHTGQETSSTNSVHTCCLSFYFSYGDLQRRKVFSLSFWFVSVIRHQVSYHSSSVWVRNERVTVLCGCYMDRSCIMQWMRLSM